MLQHGLSRLLLDASMAGYTCKHACLLHALLGAAVAQLKVVCVGNSVLRAEMEIKQWNSRGYRIGVERASRWRGRKSADTVGPCRTFFE